jgi:hypothetical protein
VTDDVIEDDGWMNNATSKQAENNEAEDGNNADLECDKTFTDTQFLDEYEEVVNVEGPNSNATEDGEDDIEQDAQSMGLDSSLPEIETMGKDAPIVTDEQSDENKGSGM